MTDAVATRLIGTRAASSIGVVVIGRNEGEQLRRCLNSVLRLTDRVVYVDSGSTDGSAAIARVLGADVIELDNRTPYTAARARNEGFQHLRERFANIAFVQFIDGDCEIVEGWLEKGATFLAARRKVAAVSGRLRERHPERSVYNLLCDMEWDVPVGQVKTCGGIAMARADAIEAVNGFRPDLIAGEEPELCLRLRASGWDIWHLDEEMAVHDAAMTRFVQWWKRALRCGYAFAQGADLHGALPERHCIRETRSAWFWGLGLPFLAIISVAIIGPIGLVVLAAYPIQVARLARDGGRSTREKWWRALFLVIGKFPEMFGQIHFLLHRYVGGQARLIEYK